jgi:broad specificity phosphatase PhoE
MCYVEVRRHTMRVKPGEHLSQEGVTLARRVGETLAPFNRVITSTIPRAFETAIAMGFAVDEEDEHFSIPLDGVEDEVGSWDAGFGAFGSAYHGGGATRRFADLLAGRLAEIARALPENGAALVISHGAIVEAAAVGCLPEANHAAWGRYCDYCEGVRLGFDAGQFTKVEIIRVERKDG